MKNPVVALQRKQFHADVQSQMAHTSRIVFLRELGSTEQRTVMKKIRPFRNQDEVCGSRIDSINLRSPVLRRFYRRIRVECTFTWWRTTTMQCAYIPRSTKIMLFS